MPEGRVCEVSRISPNYTMWQTLERYAGLHARRVLPCQQLEAPRRMYIPSNLVDSVERPCCFTLMNGGEDSSTNVCAERTDHLVEWQSLTRALLTVHVCIRSLCLHISTTSPLPKRFYKCFSLEDGTVLISVQVATYADPCLDFMLPYLRRLRQVRNPQQVKIKVDGLLYDFCSQEILRDGPPEFQDRRYVSGVRRIMDAVNEDCAHDIVRRLVQILEATFEMPYLQHFLIELQTESAALRRMEIALTFALNGSGELRKLKYEVDPNYVDLLCTNKFSAGGTFGVQTIAIPKLCALRELTGSPRDMGPYIVTVELPLLPHHHVLRVNASVRRRSSDESDSD